MKALRYITFGLAIVAISCMGTPEATQYRIVVSNAAELEKVEAQLAEEYTGEYIIEENANGEKQVIVSSQESLPEDLKIEPIQRSSSNDNTNDDRSISPVLPNLEDISFPNIFDIFSI